MNNNLTQNKQSMLGLMLVIVMAIIAVTPNLAKAETETAVVTSVVVADSSNDTDLTALLATLQSLMKQVEALQKQLAEVRGEIKDVRSELREGLKEGMSHEDIRKIQELLATDPVIYPQGLTTGYFGPLTRDALVRFQTRHELRTTGEIDAETKALILEYFKERTGNKQIPPGLLRAPGIDKKIRERLKKDEDGIISVDCTEKYGGGFLCKYGDDKKEVKDKKDEDKEDEEEDDEEDDENIIEAKKEIEAAEVAIKKLDGAIIESTNRTKRREADRKLEQAEGELAKAKVSLSDNDGKTAYDQAFKAQKIAKDALRELNK